MPQNRKPHLTNAEKSRKMFKRPEILCFGDLKELERMSDLGRMESNLPEEVVGQDEGAQVLEAVVPPVRTDTAGGRPHRVPAHFPAQHTTSPHCREIRFASFNNGSE